MRKLLPMTLAGAMMFALSAALVFERGDTIERFALDPAGPSGGTAVVGNGTLAEPAPGATVVVPQPQRCWVKTLPIDECPPDPRPSHR